MQFRTPKKAPARVSGYLVIQSDHSDAGAYNTWFQKIMRYRRKYSQYLNYDKLRMGVEINSAYVDTAGNVTTEQLLTMQDNGMEINNHCRYHVSLGKFNLTQEASAGDTKLYVSATDLNNMGMSYNSRAGYPCYYVISNGTNSETIHPNAFVYPQYFGLDAPLTYNYPIGSTVTLTASSMQMLVQGGQDDLENMELTVTSFCYPYHGGSDINPNQAAIDYVNTIYNTSRGRYGATNDIATAVWTNLKSFAIRPNGEPGESGIDDILDDTVDNNYLTFVYGHGETDAVTQHLLDYVVDGAMSRGITILTQREAYQRLAG